MYDGWCLRAEGGQGQESLGRPFLASAQPLGARPQSNNSLAEGTLILNPQSCGSSAFHNQFQPGPESFLFFFFSARFRALLGVFARRTRLVTDLILGVQPCQTQPLLLLP
jgi:hypothetical protein